MDNRKIIEQDGRLDSHNLFIEIVSKKNLFAAWEEFQDGKKTKKDVLKFSINIEENLFTLHNQLMSNAYKHGPYASFFISDPKRRHIHKASVPDRILHHAIHRILYPHFDRQFEFDSFASRTGKGVHRAVNRFQTLAWRLSRNNTRVVWVLKCDIKKFFDSVDHGKLLALLDRKIYDVKLMKLLKNIINSFEMQPGKGIPLGNLTSQLFGNIYMGQLDAYIKRKLRFKNYIRYTDDFVLLSRDRYELQGILPVLQDFLKEELLLKTHPEKTHIDTWSHGLDFLGYVSFPNHRVLRTKTKRRLFRRINESYEYLKTEKITKKSFKHILNSYLGRLKHCSGQSIKRKVIQGLDSKITGL